MRPVRVAVLVAVLIAVGGAVAWGEEAAPAQGILAAVDGSLLTIIGSNGVKRQVRLARGITILKAVRGALGDLTPGTRASIANRGPNGLQDAIEIHILAPGLPDAGDGEKRWDLRGLSRITTGRITTSTPSYDGSDITLAYKGGESTIQVGAGTPIVRVGPGSLSDLKPGAAIVMRRSRAQSDDVPDTTLIVGEAAPAMAF